MTFKVKITKKKNADYLGVPLNSIVEVGIYKYCVLVLNSEMSTSSYHMEAMKALVVALLTYVLYCQEWKHKNRDYDISDCTDDQACNFYKTISPRAYEAVDAVFKQILYEDGKLSYKARYCKNPLTYKKNRMSQVKANKQAKKGWDYKRILKYWYPDMEIVTMNEVQKIFQGNYSGDNYNISSIPYWCQADKDNGETDLTIGAKGCGIVSFAMALIGSGEERELSSFMLVDEIARYSMGNGFKKDSGTNIRGLIPAFIKDYKFKLSSYNTDWNETLEALNCGDIAVISVNGKGKLFTEGNGHIIVLVSIRNGWIEVRNPNRIGYENQDRQYTIMEVKSAFKYGVVITKGAVMKIIAEYGDKNIKVKEIQDMLFTLGYGKKLSKSGTYSAGVDGVYLVRTKDIILDFQRLHGLSETGKVDEATYNLLKELTAEPDDKLKHVAIQLKSIRDEIDTLLSEIG